MKSISRRVCLSNLITINDQPFSTFPKLSNPCKMNLLKLMNSTFSLLLTIILSFWGLSLPAEVAADTASDKKRFEEVAEQLDLGGVLYGYVSVDGDISGLAKFVNSFM